MRKAGCFTFGLAGLLVGGAAMAEVGPGIPAEAVRALNAQGARNRPENAEAPGRFSINYAANAEAPGIFLVSRACCPNHFCAFGEMPRQARHDIS